MGLREEIFSIPDLKASKPVPPISLWPGLDGKLFVRQMSAKEKEVYDRLIRQYIDPAATETLMKCRVVAMVLVDCDGNRIFTDADVNSLAERAADPIDTIFYLWMNFSGLGADSRSADDAKKNSQATASE